MNNDTLSLLLDLAEIELKHNPSPANQEKVDFLKNRRNLFLDELEARNRIMGNQLRLLAQRNPYINLGR